MENKDLRSFLDELDDFSKEVENVFKILSPAHREEKLPGLLNRLGAILLIAGEALQDQKIHVIIIDWLKAYHDELIAAVDFFYGTINAYKELAAKAFKFGKALDRKVTGNQLTVKIALFTKLSVTRTRIMNYIYDIQSIFTNKQ